MKIFTEEAFVLIRWIIYNLFGYLKKEMVIRNISSKFKQKEDF